MVGPTTNPESVRGVPWLRLVSGTSVRGYYRGRPIGNDVFLRVIDTRIEAVIQDAVRRAA
jgi:hypothetical protein